MQMSCPGSQPSAGHVCAGYLGCPLQVIHQLALSSGQRSKKIGPCCRKVCEERGLGRNEVLNARGGAMDAIAGSAEAASRWGREQHQPPPTQVT